MHGIVTAVSVATVLILFVQAKLAGARVKLDLYDKRFDVFVAALNLYQVDYSQLGDETTLPAVEREFVKRSREALFLFAKDAGISETLEKILQCHAMIKGYEVLQLAHGDDPTKRDQLLAHLNASSKARTEFPGHLSRLETLLARYLRFETIRGWAWFS